VEMEFIATAVLLQNMQFDFVQKDQKQVILVIQKIVDIIVRVVVMQILKFAANLLFMKITVFIMMQQAHFILMVLKIKHTKLDINILLIILVLQWAG
jgi:hypothetical protein